MVVVAENVRLWYPSCQIRLQYVGVVITHDVVHVLSCMRGVKCAPPAAQIIMQSFVLGVVERQGAPTLGSKRLLEFGSLDFLFWGALLHPNFSGINCPPSFGSEGLLDFCTLYFLFRRALLYPPLSRVDRPTLIDYFFFLAAFLYVFLAFCIACLYDMPLPLFFAQ